MVCLKQKIPIKCNFMCLVNKLYKMMVGSIPKDTAYMLPPPKPKANPKGIEGGGGGVEDKTCDGFVILYVPPLVYSIQHHHLSFMVLPLKLQWFGGFYLHLPTNHVHDHMAFL